MIDKLKRFDWLMFAVMLVLIAIGTMSIWSAGNARTELVFHGMWKSTLGSAILGLGLYCAIAFVDYRKLLEICAIPAYIISLVFLVVVLLVGSTIYGGSRWLWFFQPSELAKLCVIAIVALVFGTKREDDKKDWRYNFTGFLLASVLIGVPALLILAEPDLGTTLTLVPATLVMIIVAGVWRRGLITIVVSSMVIAGALLCAVYEAEKPGVPAEKKARIMRYVPLKPHQVKRIKVFFFPNEDVMGAGYNLRQAQISIGSGGLTGKGIGKGETNHLKYLPQSISMNDFIFCVYAEETGYVGSIILLVLFGLLLLSGCRIAYIVEDLRGRLLVLGIVMLVFAHVYVNIAMSIGLVPITGLPLPFISSGRTFLITIMCGFGIIQSVSIYREERDR